MKSVLSLKKFSTQKRNKPMKKIMDISIGAVLLMLVTGCYGTYYLTDSEYSDAREENASITYYDNQIYSGWSNGYYYYYGIPHYYPWNYYYNSCPPSHYTNTTHIVIARPVNRPTHRPNINSTTIKVRPNKNKVIKRPTKNKTNTKVNIKRRHR